MAIGEDDRRKIEGAIGPIDPDDEVLLDQYLDTFGVAELAALQWLRRRHAELSADALTIGSGSARVSYDETVKRLETQMSSLGRALLDSETITLAGAGEILVNEVMGSVPAPTVSIGTTVRSRRRS